MSYQPNPNAPGYWQYAGLPIQADVETHQFALAAAKKRLPAGAAVLDVAAGHGALTRALLDAGFKVSCTSWNERVKIDVPSHRVDIDQPFAVEAVGGKRFAMVCAIEIIEHSENPSQLLRSLSNVLEPGGLLAVSTPNVESAPARLEWLLRGAPYSFSGTEITYNRHISVLWRQGLEQFIALAGFDVLDRQACGAIRYHGLAQKLIKAPIHALMRATLSGDLSGNSTVYLLKKNGKTPRSLGAEEVA